MKSRWDALKPDNKDQSLRQTRRKQHATANRRRQPQRVAAAAAAATAVGVRVVSSSSSAQRTRTLHNGDLDLESLQSHFERLFEICLKNSTDWKSVESLARLVVQHSNELSSPCVCRAVRDVFLPCLSVEFDSAENNNAVKSGQSAILNSIRDLLRQPTSSSKHMIALLAPSVEDVSEGGREVQIRNPIRLALFATLQKCLLIGNWEPGPSNSSSLQQQQACQCLTAALTAATRVEGTKCHANQNARDVDPVFIRRFVAAAALWDDQDELTLSPPPSNFRSRRLALELLLAYLQRHPDASTSFVSDLLLARMPGNSGKSVICCPVCKVSVGPVFLRMFHRASQLHVPSQVAQLDHQEHVVRNTSLIVKSLVVLLRNLPWLIWLSSDNNKTAPTIDPSRTTRVQSSTLTFHHRIVKALQDVVGITNCFFRQQPTNTLSVELRDPLLVLLQTLLTQLPSQQLPEIKDSFFRLFTSMAAAAVNVENKTHDSVLQDGCRDTFIAAFGGRMTPTGCTTTMCWALKRWLERTTDGIAFVERLIYSVSSSKEYHALVLALVRSYPGAVLEREMIWTSFQLAVKRMVTFSSSNSDSKLKGCLLIEGLFHGRRYGEYHSSDLKPVDLFVPVLKSYCLDQSSGTTCCISACNVFGCLLPSDWKQVIKVHGDVRGIVKSLLSICSDCETTSGKLRAASCKAIGNISTSLLSVPEFTDDADAAVFVNDILETMYRAVDDSNSQTRCMALFAIGNIAQALNGKILQKPIDSKVLSETARQCLAKLREELDEKTVGNAIRTIGHVARLALDKNHAPSFETGGIEVTKFLSQVVFALKDRIVAVLDLTMKAKEEQSTLSKLSWKRRSAIKKQSWGACNALAGLFEKGFCEPTICGSVVECLVNCVRDALEVNEKVALAAMRAIRSLHPDIQPNVLHGDLLSDAVMSCVAVMADKKEGERTFSSKLDAEFEFTLGHLLHYISSQHASELLRKMSSEQALFLLKWIDEHDFPVETYVAFALASQTLDARLDVLVERSLSSKALLQFGEPSEEFDEL